MRLLDLQIFSVLISLCVLVWGQNLDLQARSDLSANTVPDCVTNCSLSILVQNNCTKDVKTLNDCLCANNRLQLQVSTCVRNSCNLADKESAARLSMERCKGFTIDSRQSQMVNLTIALAILAALGVIMRCWSRYWVSKEFWWDDWVLVGAGLTLISLHGLTLWGTSLGFGKHVWDVDPANEKSLFKFIWSYELTYSVVQSAAKVSVLLLYIRIFPQPWMKKLSAIVIVVAVAETVSCMLALVFACKPIALIYDKSLEGTCINSNAVAIVGAIFSLSVDMVIFVLPISSVLRLHLSPRKKLCVILIFGVGLLACISSVIRFQYIMKFRITEDPSWDSFAAAVLSSIELTLSVLCASFPAVKPLFNRWFPNLLGADSEGHPSFSSFAMPDEECIPKSKTQQCKVVLTRIKSAMPLRSKRRNRSTSPWSETERKCSSHETNLGLDPDKSQDLAL